MMRSQLMSTVVATTLLLPATIGAQEAKWRSASSDEILHVLAGGEPETIGDLGSHIGLAVAGYYAFAFLTQSSGERVHPEHFGPRSRAELDAFASQLVAIAISDPNNQATEEIRAAFRLSSATDLDDGQVQYAGAYDALRRMYEGGAGKLRDLLKSDPDRGFEYGLHRLEQGLLTDELCPFLMDLLEHGVLTTETGNLTYEPRVPDSRPTFLDRSNLATELYREGYLKTATVPCQQGLRGTITVDTIGPRTR